MTSMLSESSGLYALFFIAFLIGIRLVPMLVTRLRGNKEREVLEKVHSALEQNTEALRQATALLQEFADLRAVRNGQPAQRNPTDEASAAEERPAAAKPPG